MKPAGVVILIAVLVFLAIECFTLIKAIKDKKFKKGGKQKDVTNCDDRNSNSTSNN